MSAFQNKKSLIALFIIFTLAFAVNLYIKKDVFRQRSVSTDQAWLSAVTELYTKIWFEEGGALKNRFAQIRTFDSVEMRDLNDREVYVSFLPTVLVLPYLAAKILNKKPNLKFVQAFACLFHFLGTLLAALITFLLAKSLALDQRKSFFFSLFTGLMYIFGYSTFKTLDFGYYVDTAIHVFFLAFLLTEFIENPSKRIWLKSLVILIGLAHEWYFASITIVSLVSELFRKENRGIIVQVLASHLLPSFIVLGIYFYYINLFDKLDHVFHRTMRRTILNSVSKSAYSRPFYYLWLKFFKTQAPEFITVQVIVFWNFLESKIFKENNVYRNVLVIAFFSALMQIMIAFEHSVIHPFSGLKFFIPSLIFIPFVIDELAARFNKISSYLIYISLFALLIIGNGFFIKSIIHSWHDENPIYKDLRQAFKNYAYEDLFFSYNLEILMDQYQTNDFKTNADHLESWDRRESEPFLHLATKKQVYIIESPKDILSMLEHRDIYDAAKVHLVFSEEICDNLQTSLESRIKNHGKVYIIDINKEDLQSPDFEEKFLCPNEMKIHSFYAY